VQELFSVQAKQWTRLGTLRIELGLGRPSHSVGVPGGIAVDDTSVYWADGNANTLVKLTPK
jgi:hypothetical protein